MATHITKKWDLDLKQCKSCGYLMQRQYPECPRCKHKYESDKLMEKLK